VSIRSRAIVIPVEGAKSNFRKKLMAAQASCLCLFTCQFIVRAHRMRPTPAATLHAAVRASRVSRERAQSKIQNPKSKIGSPRRSPSSTERIVCWWHRLSTCEMPTHNPAVIPAYPARARVRDPAAAGNLSYAVQSPPFFRLTIEST
jgi:hypothetical protein